MSRKEPRERERETGEPPPIQACLGSGRESKQAPPADILEGHSGQNTFLREVHISSEASAAPYSMATGFFSEDKAAEA